jgi:Leucine-rich repeat (LRR) protein
MIGDIGISHLSGINVLRLHNNQGSISDKGITSLEGIKYLFTCTSTLITSKSISKLSGIKELCIPQIEDISGKLTYHLSGVEFLFMDWECDPISFMHLKGIKVLIIDKLYITDKHLESLSGIHTLIVRSYSDITDKGLKYISGVHTLKITIVGHISDKGLYHLRGIKKLCIGSGSNNDITDEGLKFISGVQELSIKGTNITDNGLKHLQGVQSLELCSENITSKGLRYLKGIKELRLRRADIRKVVSGLHYVKHARIVIVGYSTWHRVRRNSIKFKL